MRVFASSRHASRIACTVLYFLDLDLVLAIWLTALLSHSLVVCSGCTSSLSWVHEVQLVHWLLMMQVMWVLPQLVSGFDQDCTEFHSVTRALCTPVASGEVSVCRVGPTPSTAFQASVCIRC